MTKTKKKLRLKHAIGAAVGVAISILIVLAMRPQPVPADFATVERGPLQVTVDEEGETRVRDRFMVSAPQAGRVLRIDLEPGDEVSAEMTVVATLQPTDPVLLDKRAKAEAEARVGAARAALEMAQAERDRAGAELKYARAEEERYRRLAAEEIVSRERFETAELQRSTREKALSAAEHAVENAAQELAAARAALIRTRPADGAAGVDPISLFAPIDGVVLQRLHESEAVVPAGEALVEIADPSRLEIVSDLLSTDAVKVRRGNKVLIEQWGGEKPLQGKVRRVEPYGFTKFSALGVEEQRVNVVIDFEDPREAWEALGDGYRVEVRIVVWEREEVVQVPTSSLFREGEDWAVFVVEDGKAALRRLELGERNGLAAEVRDGVDVDDRVIVHPSDAISDGVEVEERSV